ncbi:MAG TPA: hypothetical protein VIV58_28015 [Kofleriaceae bacterium]
MRPDHPRPHTWTRLVRRAGAIATAILLVVCTVAVQTQEAAVAHVRCLEHGQLIHVTSVAPESAGDLAPALTRLAPARGGSAEHDHCPLVGTTHCAFSSLAPPPVAAVAALELARVSGESQHAPRTTFRLAPKTSPPG